MFKIKGLQIRFDTIDPSLSFKLERPEAKLRPAQLNASASESLGNIESRHYQLTMSRDDHRPPGNPANLPSDRFFPEIGIAAGSRVLDVGCGNGDLSRQLAVLAGADGEVVGIDRNESALAAARAAPAPSNAAPLRYQSADLASELPDLGSFDAIVGRRVLMYLPNAAGMLARLAAIARPGAILAFQEHARADLPSGAGALPVHRQCYTAMWDTVAAEKGDVMLGYHLGDFLRGAGFSIKQARSEAVLIHPWDKTFVPTLMQAMLPRMIEHGVVRADEIDLETLADRLDHERRMVGGTIVWDLAFLVSGLRN